MNGRVSRIVHGPNCRSLRFLIRSLFHHSEVGGSRFSLLFRILDDRESEKIWHYTIRQHALSLKIKC